MSDLAVWAFIEIGFQVFWVHCVNSGLKKKKEYGLVHVFKGLAVYQ